MRKRLLAGLAALLLLAGLALWSPWLTGPAAEQRARLAFTRAWEGVADGCGFNCQGCGVVGSRKLPGGYAVWLEYACGLLPEDSPAYHRRVEAFVSFLGTVHGLPGR